MNQEILEIRKRKILDFVNDDLYKPMKEKELSSIFEVPKNDRVIFTSLINELIQNAEIIITPKGKIHSLKKMNLIKGIFNRNAKGFGFVIPSDKDVKDIFVPFKYSSGAMHMDKVLCRVNKDMEKNKRPEGEIYKILSQGVIDIVGTFSKVKDYGFVIPDDKRICDDIFIHSSNRNRANDGHKVVVKVINRKSERNLEGEVIEILGHVNDPEVEVLGILRQYGIRSTFSDKIYEELESIKDSISESELEGREDLRQNLTVTIDGEDSKDLDDAVSLEILENGNYLLGVHIADVSHYVRENTELGNEALKRGTSVYLVDKVVPMLPHKLSNGICSLNPNIDRLTLSCIMEIDTKGNVLKHKICKSVINSDKRMTYSIVNDLLINENSQHLDDNLQFIHMLRNMGKLSQTLREKRIKRGSIEFDFPEAKIIIDENGKPIDIKLYDRNAATSLIEEFMLICNETVAEEYFWLDLPFVYRCHEEPDAEKLSKLSDFVTNLGYVLKGKGRKQGSIQKLLSNIESTPEEILISRVVLRSFKQARYSPHNTSHFGLAAKYYCHFTSPIRRFPDLAIHRIIKANISGEIGEKYMNYIKQNIDDICTKSSLAERNAETSEREVSNLKKVEFMSNKVGEDFEGIISNITNWGIYVELPNTVDGMVSLSTLVDDHYIFQKDSMKLIGEHTKKTYSLGDKVKVQLVRANREERTLDFEFLI